MTTRSSTRNIVVACVFAGALVSANCDRKLPEPTSAPPLPAPAAVVRHEARPVVVSRVVAMTFASPSLAEKAKLVLAQGTDVNLAIQGFRTPEQFMTVAYASKNLSVPFALLKDRVVTKKMTLAQAIVDTSKYSVNVTLEIARAESEARADLGRKTGPQ